VAQQKKAARARHVKCKGGPLAKVRIEDKWEPTPTLKVGDGRYHLVDDIYVWRGKGE
jgi:hypothetical protein